MLFYAQIGKALSFGVRHQEPKGLEIFHTLENEINQREVGDAEASYKIAQPYAVLGNKPAALRVFSRTIEHGFFPYPCFLTDPLLHTLRRDKRFNALINIAQQRHQSFAKSFSSIQLPPIESSLGRHLASSSDRRLLALTSSQDDRSQQNSSIRSGFGSSLEVLLKTFSGS